MHQRDLPCRCTAKRTFHHVDACYCATVAILFTALSKTLGMCGEAATPLHAPASWIHHRYFYATIYIGTPPRKFAVIVDTGSTITYVPCSSCGGSCGKHKVGVET